MFTPAPLKLSCGNEKAVACRYAFSREEESLFKIGFSLVDEYLFNADE